jgi:hypothetical protein
VSGATEVLDLLANIGYLAALTRGRDAPFGLDEAAVLEDDSAIAACLARLPDEIDGLRRTPADELEARYGGGTLVLVAIPVREEEGDAAAYVTDLIAGREPGDPPLEWADLEGDIYVLMAEEPHPVRFGRPAAVALWGRSGCRWAFGACADTPQRREALMRAFAKASTPDD